MSSKYNPSKYELPRLYAPSIVLRNIYEPNAYIGNLQFIWIIKDIAKNGLLGAKNCNPVLKEDLLAK